MVTGITLIETALPLERDESYIRPSMQTLQRSSHFLVLWAITVDLEFLRTMNIAWGISQRLSCATKVTFVHEVVNRLKVRDLVLLGTFASR